MSVRVLQVQLRQDPFEDTGEISPLAPALRSLDDGTDMQYALRAPVQKAPPPLRSLPELATWGVEALCAEDRRLIEAIRAGDPRAAAPLYARLRPSIEHALYRVLGRRPPEFEDLMQITYERVMLTVAAGHFEGKSQLKTWAGGIARRVALDHVRRCRVEQRAYELMASTALAPQVQGGLPEQRLEARSEAERVQAVLKRMKPRRAKILVLHDALGHTVPQVATLLGMNVSAARSTLRRARQEFARRCSSTLHPNTEI